MRSWLSISAIIACILLIVGSLLTRDRLFRRALLITGVAFSIVRLQRWLGQEAGPWTLALTIICYSAMAVAWYQFMQQEKARKRQPKAS